MPVWHDATREWVNEGRLAILGITQEQHADRCRLFAQWKKFDWPILHDPINVLRSTAVPIFVAIDEHGIVRSISPKLTTFEGDFLDVTYEDDDSTAANSIIVQRNLASLEREAQAADNARAWRELGDALVMWSGASRIDDAIAAYMQAVKIDPQDADSLFRLGVCHRMRHESPGRRADDFQTAVDYWGQALTRQPNQYIWRRRIQQYGPRLDKPYPFYDWTNEAVAEIRNRHEIPIRLAVLPYGAELARPLRRFEVAQKQPASPDPEGQIHRDTGLIETEVTVVPATGSAGRDFRIHVTFIPNRKRAAHWNNEVEPLRLWVEATGAWEISDQLLAAPPGEKPETNEIRQIDFEVKARSHATSSTKLAAYALYYVCEDVGGKCLYLRQDIDIKINAR